MTATSITVGASQMKAVVDLHERRRFSG